MYHWCSADNRGGKYVWGLQTYGNFLLPVKFCYESQTAPKIKLINYKKNKLPRTPNYLNKDLMQERH